MSAFTSKAEFRCLKKKKVALFTAKCFEFILLSRWDGFLPCGFYASQFSEDVSQLFPATVNKILHCLSSRTERSFLSLLCQFCFVLWAANGVWEFGTVFLLSFSPTHEVAERHKWYPCQSFGQPDNCQTIIWILTVDSLKCWTCTNRTFWIKSDKKKLH